MFVAQSDQLAPRDRFNSPTIDPATMPAATPAVIMLLKEGIRSSRLLFPENGPTRRIETWRPPKVMDRQLLEDVKNRMRNLAVAREPALPGDLLSRIMVLLAHYRIPEHSKATEYGIALDWADDLAAYPMWAVEDAARKWRRTKKYRPQICEMVELCEGACDGLRTELRRLDSVVVSSGHDQNPCAKEERSDTGPRDRFTLE